jgi:hypothetical protein
MSAYTHIDRHTAWQQLKTATAKHGCRAVAIRSRCTESYGCVHTRRFFSPSKKVWLSNFYWLSKIDVCVPSVSAPCYPSPWLILICDQLLYVITDNNASILIGLIWRIYFNDLTIIILAEWTSILIFPAKLYFGSLKTFTMFKIRQNSGYKEYFVKNSKRWITQ